MDAFQKYLADNAVSIKEFTFNRKRAGNNGGATRTFPHHDNVNRNRNFRHHDNVNRNRNNRRDNNRNNRNRGFERSKRHQDRDSANGTSATETRVGEEPKDYDVSQPSHRDEYRPTNRQIKYRLFTNKKKLDREEKREKVSDSVNKQFEEQKEILEKQQKQIEQQQQIIRALQQQQQQQQAQKDEEKHAEDVTEAVMKVENQN